MWIYGGIDEMWAVRVYVGGLMRWLCRYMLGFDERQPVLRCQSRSVGE